MKFTETDKVLIMGRSGCGKTHLSQKIQKIWPRRIIIDPMHEYTDRKTGKPIYPGAVVVSDFSEFGRELIKFENKKNWELIYQFSPENENPEDEYNEICCVAYKLGNIQVVTEEVQLFSNPHNLPHWLWQLLLTGRHQNISLLFTSQRPGEINKTIISQCGHIFCGHIFEGNDLKYVSNFLHGNSDKLINLPNRKFIWFTAEGVKEISNDF